MGSLTHSRRPNGRDTPHHIRCLSCRSGFFDDLLPTAVPGLDTNAGGTLCSIVPSVSGHPRRTDTGRVHLARERCHKAVLTLIRRCYSHIRAPDRPHGRGVLRRRCGQPSALVERDTPVPFPSPAQGRPAPAWHADGPCPMFLGPVLVLRRRQSHHHTPQNMPFVASHDSPRDSAYKYHLTLWHAPQCPIAPEILSSTFGHNLNVSGSRVPVAALFRTSPSRPTKLDSLYLDLPPKSSQYSTLGPTRASQQKSSGEIIQICA